VDGVGTLGHVGIAVKDIDAAIARYRELSPDLIVSFRTVVADQGVEVCFLDFPAHSATGRIELLQSISANSGVAKFIETRGEGLHHLCFTCKNIETRLAELSKLGYTLIDKEPRIGALGKKIAFVHPKSTGGTLIELEEE
jgi:methylmalonyl-CoA/ethylmalonyl-CoA epimerase